LPAEIERTFAMNNSLNRLCSAICIAFVFIACQAGEPKAQKRTITKQTATATPVSDTAQKNTVKAQVPTDTKIIVYYFHGHQRCPTCHNLENYAKQAVESSFPDAINKNALEWKTVNVEIAGNEHFNDDYKLYTKSIIVSTRKDGKEVSWKNLDQIWQLVRDETKYKEYIIKEVNACLQGKCL
jgi:PBP1b-binding outer membrane lipoprotein LpoB